jgi:hypothetical protein
MSESKEVEKKFNTWKEVGALLKPVYEKLDGRKSKKSGIIKYSYKCC